MKNLNRTIEKATTSNLSHCTSVNRKIVYSLCFVLCFLICSLSTKAKSTADYRHSYHYGYGFFYSLLSGDNSGKDMSNLFVLPTFGFSSPNVTSYYGSAQTGSSPYTNNYGALSSGNDEWIQINLADDGYMRLHGGTSNFDSVFYLFDSTWTLIATGDDGDGSGYGTHNYLQPVIEEYLNAGTYYLIVDGTNKYGAPTSGDVGLNFILQ